MSKVWAHAADSRKIHNQSSSTKYGTDNTNVAMFVINVPNVATAFVGQLTVCGGYSDGDGCDVKVYNIAVSRVAGVAVVATLSAAAAVANNASTGHTSMTATATLATAGGATANNTVTVNLKVAAGSAVIATAFVHPLTAMLEFGVPMGQATVNPT